MKVSLNLAQDFSNVNLKSIPHETLLKRVGAQLGAVEEATEWAPKYKDILVVKIVSCEDHPNADRLHVCMIDDGGKAKSVKRDSKGLVQVVCGAPNVKAGMYVAWIPPAATVPTSYGTPEPFILDARELRGVVSNGMLASAKELGINEDHDGILELDELEGQGARGKGQSGKALKPGDLLVNYFGLDDFVIDCENKMFTHRPDCFGNIGVARELAGISRLGFKSPDWYLQEPKFENKSQHALKGVNSIGKLVPRFMAVAMGSVEIGPSPMWLQALLKRVGLKSINNVVDITAYVMHSTGQPMHAFDADKLASHQLGPRMAKKGEKIALLNGKEIELTEDDMVIATEHKAVALAGVMGGSETEVDNETKNVVLECATFDMYTVRRTSMRHGLFTEASTRYTKGQSPLQNARVLAYAMKLIGENAGAVQTSSVVDIKHGKLEDALPVTINASFINERLGTSLSLKDIARLLENVEFAIMSVPADKNRLHIRPPFWRTDIEIPEDIVEEVGRLHGFDEMPLVLPDRTTKPASRSSILDLKATIRRTLAAAGANEILTYSFIHGDLMKKTGQDSENAFHLRNALSPDLQYYRLSLTPSLLDKVNMNIRSDMVRGDDNEFAIFEIGKAHSSTEVGEDEIPREFDRLALVFATDEKTVSKKYSGAPYYQARKYLDSVLDADAFTLQPLSEAKTDCELVMQMLAPFNPERAAVVLVKDQIVGVVGEYTAGAKKSFKLPEFSAGFELFLSAANLASTNKYAAVSSFPKSQQDVTFEVSADTDYATLNEAFNESLEAAAEEHDYQAVIMSRDIFQQEGSDKKRFTFRLWLVHPSKTLTMTETNHLLDEVALTLKEKLSAERI